MILDELVRSTAPFTVRASWNRRIKDVRSQKYLREKLANERVQLRYDVHVSAGHKRTERTARVVVRTASVGLNVGHDWQAKRANPRLNVVWVRENRVAKGDKPRDWMLYTNAPIDTPQDILRVVRSCTM